MKIFIDAGHGGTDPGAVNSVTGLREADINLDTAARLNTVLTARGYETRMSRTTDVFIPLNERARMANSWGADYYIAVHCNSFDNSAANGTETLYYTGSSVSEAFAGAIQSQLLTALGLADRGIIPRNLAVLRLSNMPAVLVELAFISNPNEAYLLSTPDFRQKAADAMANGVADFAGPAN